MHSKDTVSIMAIKCKDLAKLLGVSTATISLVINNKPGISPHLRDKLVKQIEELGYGDMLAAAKPKEEPDSKAKKKSIAYIIYTTGEDTNDNFSFFPAVLEGAEMQARENGYNIQVMHLGQCKTCKPIDCIDRDETIGIIAQIDYADENIVQDLYDTHIPFIVLDCYSYKRNISSVCVNNEDGMFMAVKYLIEMGHKKIGYIASGMDTDSFLERRRCYHQALREYRLEDKPEFRVFSGGMDGKAVVTLAKQWEHMGDMPTAFLVENDILAWRTIKAIKKLGLRVPEDISVIGFDDRSVAQLTDPALTTIRVHRHLMGRQGVMLLLNLSQMLDAGFHGVPYKMNVGVTLIKRDSVARLN